MQNATPLNLMQYFSNLFVYNPYSKTPYQLCFSGVSDYF